MYDVPVGVADDCAAQIIERGENRAPVFVPLQLPFLENVPLSTLIEIRQASGDAFHDFQAALRHATRELTGDGTSVPPEKLTRQIVGDVIQPELRRITTVFAGARDALARKSAAAIVLGVAAASVGVLFGAPLGTAAVAGAAAAAAAANVAAAKFFDARDELRRSNLYFLWRLKSDVHGE